jgi:hypothetical protein
VGIGQIKNQDKDPKPTILAASEFIYIDNCIIGPFAAKYHFSQVKKY